MGLQDELDPGEALHDRALTGWSTSGVLTTGSGTQIGTLLAAQPTGPTVTLQADFANTEGAANFTVQFGLLPQGKTANNALYMAEAIILMTVEGNTIQRRINIMNGTSFTGTAEAVRVIVFDTTPTNPAIYPGSPPFPAGLQYIVTITVAKGTRPGRVVPPILMPPASNFGAAINNAPGSVIINNTNAQFPVPQDAGITSTLCLVIDPNNPFGTANNKASQLLVSLSGTAGLLMGFYPAQYQATSWIPFPLGVVDLFISVIIPGGGSTSELFLQAYFGVDG